MIEIILDASQLEVFEACPRKWYYSYIRNLVPIKSHQSFNIGSYYHEVFALFYSLPLGPSHYKDLPITKDLWKTWLAKIGIEKDFNTRLKIAVDFAAHDALLKKYNIRDLDAQKFHRKRIVDYLYKWISEDEQTEVIAVEQGFTWLLYEDSGRRFLLEGKIDFVGRNNKYGLFVMDHKTQSRFDDRFEFNHQVCNYMSHTKANYFVYNYIGLQDKLPKEGLRRIIYKPHPGMLDQWKFEVMQTFQQMYHYRDQLAEHEDYRIYLEIFENLVYPRRRAACDASKYGLCAYHKLCSVPDDSKWVKVVESAYKEKDEKWRAWT